MYVSQFHKIVRNKSCHYARKHIYCKINELWNKRNIYYMLIEEAVVNYKNNLNEIIKIHVSSTVSFSNEPHAIWEVFY